MVQPLRGSGKGVLTADDAGRQKRRLDLLRRSGLFEANAGGFTVRPACRPDDLRAVYRLVHDTFVEKGYILPQASGMRVRAYEAAPELVTYVAVVENRPVGVMSILADSEDLRLPSDEAFDEELGWLRSLGRRLCEATNQAVAPAYRRSAVTTELMRCCMAQAIRGNHDEVLAAVTPSHRGFYELIGFREVGTVRSYSRKVEDPVVLMSLDLRALVAGCDGGEDEVAAFMHRFFVSQNPYMEYVEGWAILARHIFSDPEALHDLFVSGTGLLDRCTDFEREAIGKRWGTRLFAEVFGSQAASGEPPAPAPGTPARREGPVLLA